MKRPIERFVWISVTAVLAIALVGLIFAPKLMAQNKDPQTEDYLEMFESVFHFVMENYVEEVPPEQLFEGAMKGLFESLDDPYSVYLTASDMQDMSDTTTGRFGGVGLYISKPQPGAEEENGALPFVEIVAPIEGTPAFKAGLSAGDYILEIEGESTEPLTIDEVVNRLRGEPGEPVTVSILREKEITFDVTLERAVIEIPTVKHDLIKEPYGTFGYIRIIQFTPYTAERIQDSLDDFEDQGGYQALILDVRNNPGGLLDSVVKVSDKFLSGGTIVSTRSRVERENEIYRARDNTAVPGEIPVVVLLDGGSASASEILAGALKDRGRGVLIGETSYGKGSVQQIFRSYGESGFKLTMSRYYTPSGVNIDKIGIDPDLKVELPEMSDQELNDYKNLIEEKRVEAFVDENENPSESQRQAFIAQLRAEGIEMEALFLERMIQNEVTRRMDVPPVYNLKYDIILQRAVEYLKKKGGLLSHE